MVIFCAVDVRSKDRGSQAAIRQPESPSGQQAETHAQHDDERKTDEAPAWRQGAVLLLCWGVFVMFTLLLSHYHRCSAAYWSIFAVQSAACVGAEALFICLVSLPHTLDLSQVLLLPQGRDISAEDGTVAVLESNAWAATYCNEIQQAYHVGNLLAHRCVTGRRARQAAASGSRCCTVHTQSRRSGRQPG